MDCQMPEMDGYEATRQIRKLGKQGSQIPVIAMTADAGTGCRERCLDAGMNDFITKPVKIDDLVKTLETWLPTPSPPECSGCSVQACV